jgi:hypothetical protein
MWPTPVRSLSGYNLVPYRWQKDYLFLSKILTDPQTRHRISKYFESTRTKSLLQWITRTFQMFSLWFYIFRWPWCLFISVKRSTEVWLKLLINIKSNILTFRSIFTPFRTQFDKEFWNLLFHVRWVPCHHGMRRPQVADGGSGLQIWRVAANILNKQSRIADKGRSSSWGGGGVGHGANNSPP